MPYKTNDLLNLSESIAAPFLAKSEYPWQALCDISQAIIDIGSALPKDIYEMRGEDIWIAKTASIAPSAFISGPCIIDEYSEIRHCAYIRGSVIIGKGAVVGNSTELKNCILFNGVQVPHFNYIGDSILGHMAHLGAGAVTSNVKSDKTHVFVKAYDDEINTGLKKFGAIVGDFAEVGCNSVLNPGTVLGRDSQVYPTSCVRGFVPARCIFKANGVIARKY